MADLGYGSTLAWNTNDWTLTNITWTGPTFESFRTTTLATTGGHEFVGSDCYDPGEITAEILWDAAQANPPIAAGGTVGAATFSAAGQSIGASAFMTSFSVSTPVEDLVTATVTLKLTGDLTIA